MQLRNQTSKVTKSRPLPALALGLAILSAFSTLALAITNVALSAHISHYGIDIAALEHQATQIEREITKLQKHSVNQSSLHQIHLKAQEMGFTSHFASIRIERSTALASNQ